jgi:hypothetical protein
MSKKLNKKKTPIKLVEAVSTQPIRLDLGCGQNPKEGFEGVDLYGDKAKHIVDLFKFPWPFKDNSVDEIYASHLLEHVPAREVENRDLVDPVTAGRGLENRAGTRYLGADMLFAFMDECWRIMKMDAWMTVIVPSGRSSRAFWDPTHRRFFMQETFFYFFREWRKQNGLDHYRISANFGANVTHSMLQEEGLRSAEVQAERFRTLWNITIDWHARLQKQA